jgi:hypothetical protein
MPLNLAGKYRRGRRNHELPEMLDARIVAQRLELLRQHARSLAVAPQHILLREPLEDRQAGPAGQRIPGVRMRMQEAARDVVVEESVIDRVARHHQ